MSPHCALNKYEMKKSEAENTEVVPKNPKSYLCSQEGVNGRPMDCKYIVVQSSGAESFYCIYLFNPV
jgi:hypothetical protein